MCVCVVLAGTVRFSRRSCSCGRKSGSAACMVACPRILSALCQTQPSCLRHMSWSLACSNQSSNPLSCVSCLWLCTGLLPFPCLYIRLSVLVDFSHVFIEGVFFSCPELRYFSPRTQSILLYMGTHCSRCWVKNLVLLINVEHGTFLKEYARSLDAVRTLLWMVTCRLLFREWQHKLCAQVRKIK